MERETSSHFQHSCYERTLHRYGEDKRKGKIKERKAKKEIQRKQERDWVGRKKEDKYFY